MEGDIPFSPVHRARKLVISFCHEMQRWQAYFSAVFGTLLISYVRFDARGHERLTHLCIVRTGYQRCLAMESPDLTHDYPSQRLVPYSEVKEGTS